LAFQFLIQVTKEAIMAKGRAGRIKKMPRDQFEHVMNLEWAPVKLEGGAIPGLLAGIPSGVLHSVYASGSPIPELFYSDHVMPSGFLIGGIDVYRNAPEDPVALNKDWYAVIAFAGSDSMLLVRGPIKDAEPWLDDIPERLKGVTVLAVPPLKTTSSKDK
jgi:hypothetical protein